MTSSSYQSGSTDYSSSQGRLGNAKSIWCAQNNQQNKDQWLQIDLGAAMKVTGVETEGDGTRSVLTYQLKYSMDKTSWAYVLDSDGNQVLLNTRTVYY